MIIIEERRGSTILLWVPVAPTADAPWRKREIVASVHPQHENSGPRFRATNPAVAWTYTLAGEGCAPRDRRFGRMNEALVAAQTAVRELR